MASTNRQSFLIQILNRIVTRLVNARAFHDNYASNPFVFQKKGANSILQYFGGEEYSFQPL